MPKTVEKIDKAMEIIERNCVGFATLGMVAIVFINVILRNFFESGLVWGNELTSYLNIFAVYIAISAGFKYGSHVGVSAFVDFIIPKKLRKPVSVLTLIIILFFCGMVFYLAIKMSVAQLETGQSSPVLSIPLWTLYGIMGVGMAMSCVRVIMEIIKIVIPNDGIDQGGAGIC